MIRRDLSRRFSLLLASCFLLLSPLRAQQVSLTGQVAGSGQISTAPKIIYAQSGFETGNYSEWSGTFYTGQTPTQTAPDVQTSVVRSGTYASHDRYFNLADTFSGTVNTSGTAVAWVSGNTFGLGWDDAPASPIVINGVTYTISSVTNSTNLVLTATAGTQTGVSYTCIGNSHQDVNIHQFMNFGTAQGYPNGLEEFYIRFYVRYHLNAGGTDAGTSNTFQRKVLFLKSFTGEPTEGGATGNFVITSDANKFRLAGGTWAGQGGDASSFSYGAAPPYLMTPPDRHWDAPWTCMEVHIKLNTPGSSDGVLEFWVDGTQYLSYTAYNVRGTATTGWKRVEIGVQADRQFSDPIDEERYWDDVVISSSYIGP